MKISKIFQNSFSLLEKSSIFFLKFQFLGVTQNVLLENSSIQFFDWNHIWYVTFGLDELSSKMAHVTPQNSPIDDWVGFPVKRSSSGPDFKKKTELGLMIF